ncbi:hypothetical protein EOD40_04020 [Flavobacterium sufflavum]|uniref:Guanylate cyclase domain-containing protein n=1 Tax=Flavobacterium sufflavum TaxID=1921138 RepID=A0A3S2U4Y1_9FLAO|nr:hypothetical protein [Flavobacterium sufflavum]RVT78411.1 hypothetical protein EOD40_04020 [Flavobacterium sufflavum]
MAKTRKQSWNVTENRFICFLDIMGFKDMVMRNSHNEIYQILEELAKERSTLDEGKVESYETDSMKTVSFSDTIVIFTKTDSKECLELITFAVSWLFARAMEKEIPIKGAIACGTMSVNISRQIFFGQPLIDAYLLQEDVAFYGLVLHNTAEKKLNEYIEVMIGDELYHDCKVPLKSGKIDHFILDWVAAINFENGKEEAKKIGLDLMKKHRHKTSGGPRKYIDNTIEIINQIYN